MTSLCKKLDEDKGPKDVLTSIRKIKDLEERKLRFTVDYQLALQQEKDMPNDELLEKNAKGLKKMLDKIAEEINECIEEIRELVFELEDDGAAK